MFPSPHMGIYYTTVAAYVAFYTDFTFSCMKNRWALWVV
jgi:hypothetical protein